VVASLFPSYSHTLSFFPRQAFSLWCIVSSPSFLLFFFPPLIHQHTVSVAYHPHTLSHSPISNTALHRETDTGPESLLVFVCSGMGNIDTHAYNTHTSPYQLQFLLLIGRPAKLEPASFSRSFLFAACFGSCIDS